MCVTASLQEWLIVIEKVVQGFFLQGIVLVQEPCDGV